MSETIPRLTETEFDELKRKRDEGISKIVGKALAHLGCAPDEQAQFHCHDYRADCYCACPDGPCQHEWNGPWEESDYGGSITCSRCGMDNMSHALRTAP